MQPSPCSKAAFPALLLGAAGIGFAPIFVRLSEVGPSSTAFYRVFLALPVLWLWVQLESEERAQTPAAPLKGRGSLARLSGLPADRSLLWLLGLAGSCFAVDLALWHWAIKLTTIANSTLLTNFAPFFVMLGGRLIFGEKLGPFLIVGMVLAFAGAAMLVGTSVRLAHENVLGDVLAIAAAVFYGAYLLSVKHLRSRASTAVIMFGSGLVSSSLFLIIALCSGEKVAVETGYGWLILFALALASHVGGQGLIAFALAHLPASFSSIGLFLQPLVAVALAWWLLGEAMSAIQMAGACVVLAGIATARMGKP